MIERHLFCAYTKNHITDTNCIQIFSIYFHFDCRQEEKKNSSQIVTCNTLPAENEKSEQNDNENDTLQF